MFRLLVIIAIQSLFVHDLSMALKIFLAELLAQDGHQVHILAPI
uniref:Glucuronosyltransferase n=1 Tax=Globodera pallida TaxID=36090 RepID=A0A183CRS2_GLOPA